MSYDPTDDLPEPRVPAIVSEPYEGEFDENTGEPIQYADCQECGGNGYFEVCNGPGDDGAAYLCEHCDGYGNVRVG